MIEKAKKMIKDDAENEKRYYQSSITKYFFVWKR